MKNSALVYIAGIDNRSKKWRSQIKKKQFIKNSAKKNLRMLIKNNYMKNSSWNAVNNFT